MAANDIVDLAAAKAQLNITSSAHDAELPGFISAASRVVDRHVGPVIRRSVTETFDGGRCQVLLSQTPVASVTSVTDTGTLLAASDYKVDGPSGVLTRVSGRAPRAFEAGVLGLVVVYVAGRVATIADVAESYGDFRLATLIILQHMWETQRPAQSGPYAQSGDEFDPRYTYSVPRRALELLGDPVGGIA